MKFLLPQFILLLIAFSFSCKTTQTIPDLNTLKKEIIMDKNPCFGTCPYYTLTIYEKGYASFEGKKDVKKMGLHSKKLSQKEYEGVMRAFKASNFFELDDDYPSQVSDLPKTAITYNKDGKSKTVTGDDLSRPAIVLSLDSLLTQIAQTDGWTSSQTSNTVD